MALTTTFSRRYAISMIRIGMRLAIDNIQKWNPVSTPPAVCDFYLCKSGDNPKPHVYYYDGEYNGFFEGRGVQMFDVTEWRQIEFKEK